jgi:hypothetical protein
VTCKIEYRRELHLCVPCSWGHGLALPGRHVVRAATVLLSLLLLISPAYAQRAQPLFEAGELGMPFSARDFAAADPILSLDPEQKAAARALYGSYRSAFMAATARMNDVKDKAPMDDLGMSRPEGWEAQVAAYVDQVRSLQERLLSDLKSLCTPAQAERFESYERAVRRRHAFRISQAAGDSVELPDVLRAIKIDPARLPGAAEVLSRWETDVDRVLLDKLAYTRANYWTVADIDAPDAKAKIRKFARDLMQLSERVRDLNGRAARELEALLPEEARDPFRAEIEVRTWPEIFGVSRAQRAIDGCAKLAGVTPEQRDALERLRAEYVREARPINLRFAAAAAEMQAKLPDTFDTVMLTRDDPKVPYWAVAKERHALDDGTVEKARAILGKEQVERLPNPEPDSEIPEFMAGARAAQQEVEEEFGPADDAP